MPYLAADPLISAFMRFRLRRKPSLRTAEEYGRDLEHFGRFLAKRADEVTFHGPFERLLKATRLDILKYADFLGDKRLAKKLSTAAVRRRLSAVHSFYKFLQVEDRRSDNPSALVGLPPPEKTNPKPIDEDSLAQLLRTVIAGQSDFCRIRNRAILEVLYATGIRRAELIGFNVEDVDFKGRTMRVIGKGGEPRTVVFNEAAKAAMEVYVGCRPRTGENAFFVTERGRRISHSQAGKIFRQYALFAQIGKVTPHMMRHSFATHLIAHGADLQTVQKLLGHKSPATTQIYVDITLIHQKRAYDAAHPRDKRDDM
jgi:site-specific recombinase XerD